MSRDLTIDLKEIIEELSALDSRLGRYLELTLLENTPKQEARAETRLSWEQINATELYVRRRLQSYLD